MQVRLRSTKPGEEQSKVVLTVREDRKMYTVIDRYIVEKAGCLGVMGVRYQASNPSPT